MLACGAVGGILPDLEKLWNGWQRGAWHVYGLWIGLGLIGAGLAVSLGCRLLCSRLLR